MRNKLALLLVAGLALTGCSVSGSPLPTVYGPAAVETVIEASPIEDLSQNWADTMINHYLNGHGAASFRGFLEGTPQRDINSWSSPDDGVLLVVVSSNLWNETDLGHLAWDIMSKAGWEDPSLKTVRVTAYDGSESVDYPRTSIDGLY